ncbi:hypothetical protein HQ45_05640 [Porphyromonas crevioricanis]|uniref:Cell division protein ZapA n=2 Tax=Porphyromonas crevioricanis TaxID=393921 RepID=A0A0A2FZG4_9PORP|nr:cell division protein ZapA [Porphyromonas crevioricanis]KGN90266.1 hypothetical protein HQ45_05640 [Porphyromonas crevioricanis]KGN96366.1 hypothetical protein HQ38_01905 [Porphyromonas crevioricanis]SJZ95864.1 Cell division protein ZapA [Porphyromonas crevioricanis]SQH72702.1 Uncharacterised protein [Porphyromonas crevioricanis]GAD05830.1 hypothetical protein PORCRE_1539 [Porphyromonas crevioricanis JCM 15906]
MDSTEGRQQSITLIVQGIRLPLVVDSRLEPCYRMAAAELNARIESYKVQYGQSDRISPEDYLAMAALDRSYYLHRTRKEVDTAPLMEEVRRLNSSVEEFLRQYR